jgi:hypothetical protein
MSLTVNEIESHLKKIGDSLQRQNASHSQLQNSISNLQQQILAYKNQAESELKQFDGDLKKVTDQLRLLAEDLTPRFKDIEDIPGIRTPKWYEVVVPFEVGDSSEKMKSIEINPEGPFIMTQITPVWQISNDNDSTYFANTISGVVTTVTPPVNRIIPATAFPMIVNNLGYTNTTSVGYNTPSLTQLCSTLSGGAGNPSSGPLRDIPELELQIEIAGSGRYWTTGSIPSAAFYGYGGQPLYLATQGWVERTDRIIIHATPLVPIPHNGFLRFVMHGYQILGHISISEALGY